MMESALIKIEKLGESIGDEQEQRIVAVKLEIGIKNSIAMFVS